MDFGEFHFGRIEIDGATYKRDVVIDRGRIRNVEEQNFGTTRAPPKSSVSLLKKISSVRHAKKIREVD
jgi:hypothetical protein